MKKIWNFLKNNVWESALTIGAFIPDAVGYIMEVAPNYLPSLLEQLPEHTFLAKLALPLSIYIKFKKHKKAYQKDELPNGLSKFYDKVPNAVTGVKGSKK